MTSEELMELSERAERATTRLAELVGRKKHILAEMTERFGCATPAAAEKKIKTLQREISKLTDKIEKKVAELDEEITDVEDN